jgi:hypothetical protein
MLTRHLPSIVAAALGASALLACARGTAAKDTNLGTSLTPAHVPHQTDRDMERFFDEAGEMGSNVTWIVEWVSLPPSPFFQAVCDRVHRAGMKFHLYLSPIVLAPGRKDPAIPASVGGTSFADPKVRKAYIDEVVALASVHPDYLGLATEVNFLVQNPPEFEAFTSLVHETYRAVKAKYPEQVVTISFQWDVMKAHPQMYPMLKVYGDAIDVYSFTTYPDAVGVGDPAKMPADYYADIRKLLPTERVGVSEIGWSSAPPSDERQQAAFYARLPELFKGMKLEFVTLGLLHDVDVFRGELERLNHVGVIDIDDNPKPAWDVILKLPKLE